MILSIADSVALVRSFGIRFDRHQDLNHWIYWQYDGDVQHLTEALRDCPRLARLTLRASYRGSRVTKETIEDLMRLPNIRSLDLDLRNLPFYRNDSLLYKFIDHHSIVPGLRSLHYHASSMYVPEQISHLLNLGTSLQLEEIIICLDDHEWESYFRDMATSRMSLPAPRETIIRRLMAMVSCGQLQKARLIRLLRRTTHYNNEQQALLAYDLPARTYSLLPRNAAWDADGKLLPWPCEPYGDNWDDTTVDRYSQLCRLQRAYGYIKCHRSKDDSVWSVFDT